ncbi:MAG: AarF/ABC1/UbiB kinase family protein [Pseudanabaenaceae cyanobacterium SKYGB_i_bin29]|nr:AarF/ABC1/UbiB kinase family protein [Pseudanabaenaceae cyanobacterium SKYG29]MDW8421088.1 AarF/ABC1/UbiB kinase family protein [Pseudanabaenaceae cyanobacterium SKYGB_i_bin29]
MLTKRPQRQLTLKWQRQKYSAISRQIEVFTAVFTFLFLLWWDSWRGDTSSQCRRRRSAWLVQQMLDLGPVFIKIGQSLSTRLDLLPKEYIEAFAELQDCVPPFSAEEAATVIELELGKPLFAIYRDFNPEPLASASLGQVHRARLHTGEEVVVKVQRPGLKRLFDLDYLAIQKLLAVFRKLGWFKQWQLEEISQEFFTVLYQEIDYIHEGNNADRFRQNFQDMPRILVPKVYWQYSTAKVLTLEYLPGIKVADRAALEACGIDPTEINQLGIYCYLRQLLQDGFFHADPHPGNIAVSPRGELIFYDFGMMVEVPALSKEQMVKTFFAVLKKDTDTVISTLTGMGLLEPVNDMAPVKRLFKFLLDRFTERPVNLKELESIKREIYSVFEQQPFRLPAKMIYILKSLATLDGLARILDPEYNLTAAAQPFVQSITAQNKSSLLGELWQQARSFLAYRFNQPSRTELLVLRLEERLERGELEIQIRSMETERLLKRVHLALKVLVYLGLAGFTLAIGVLLLLFGQGQYQGWVILLFSVGAFCTLTFLRLLFTLSWKERLDKLAEN